MNAWIALLPTTLSWAATFHVAKFAVALVPPAEAAAWRFVIAAVVMVPIVTLRDGWDWPALRRNAVALLILGGFGICGFQLGMFYGLQSSSAVNAALITSLSPALSVLLVSLMEWRAMSTVRWLGLLLGLLGGLVVVTGGSWAALRALSVGRGDLWLAMAALSWAIYAMILRRHVRGLSGLQFTAVTIVICALVLSLGTAVILPGQLRVPPAAAWWPLVFMGTVGSGCVPMVELGRNQTRTRVLRRS